MGQPSVPRSRPADEYPFSGRRHRYGATDGGGHRDCQSATESGRPVGDGGLSLNLGELATLAQEKANVTLLIMNDGGYGVMRGIQDKYFGGRQYYNELHTPDFTLLAQAIGLQAWSVERAEDFRR